MNDDVLPAVDPHKASNTVAVLDPVTKTLIESARFANSADGYERLTAFAARWAQRRWAVEGCRGAGRSLAQRLVAAGEPVLDVPAKLAARVRLYLQGHGPKTDKNDAVPIGLAALTAAGSPRWCLMTCCKPSAASADGRNWARCAPRRHAGCTACWPSSPPGGMRRELSAGKAEALLARIRPGDDVARIRLQLAWDHLADIRALDGRLKAARTQIADLVAATGTTLTSLYRIGPGDRRADPG